MEERIIDEVNPQIQIRAFFLCGSLLIFAGAGVLYMFSLMAFESLWHLSGSVESERTFYLAAGLVVAAIATVGLTVVGFFVTRKNGTPLWYAIICGIIPGFLLLVGWGAIHAGLAKRKGLQVAGLRRVVTITAVVALLPLMATMPQPYGFYLAVGVIGAMVMYRIFQSGNRADSVDPAIHGDATLPMEAPSSVSCTPASKTTCDQCGNSFPSGFYLQKSKDDRYLCEKCQAGLVV